MDVGSEPLQPSGQRLRRHRWRKGLTQKSLADLSGVHNTYISELERGIAVGGPETWYKLALALGIDVEDLFDDEVERTA